MEPLEPVQMNIYQTNTCRKDFSRLHFDNEPRVQERQQGKDQQSYISVFVVFPGSPAQTWQQYFPRMAVWQIYEDTEQPQEKETSENESSFSNGDNLRAPIQFRRESQPQHLKRLFFLKNRLIHCHNNSTGVIRLVKWNQLSFWSIEINKPLLAPDQI